MSQYAHLPKYFREIGEMFKYYTSLGYSAENGSRKENNRYIYNGQGGCVIIEVLMSFSFR